MHITLLLPDSLQRMGIHYLLDNFFAPVSIVSIDNPSELTGGMEAMADFFITNAESFALHLDFFVMRRNKTIIVSSQASSLPNHLYQADTQENIIYKLQDIFTEKSDNASSNEANKSLSTREIEILKLITQGNTSKEIADKLFISLNTVLTHRKNITSKLGIKTVSGLTYYAIMNGIVSVEEIEL